MDKKIQWKICWSWTALEITAIIFGGLFLHLVFNLNDGFDAFLLFLLVLFCLPIFLLEISGIRQSPYKYPYFTVYFDVSGKRKPNINDYIDRYISNAENWSKVMQAPEKVKAWEETCERELSPKKILKKYRMKQFQASIDDAHLYQFVFYRQQTRYSQINYQKIPYKVNNRDSSYSMNLNGMKSRYQALSEIGFECTLDEYNRKEQRQLMTPQLRQYIMKRDNYTCQICGKYMPDGVGLQIDHIIPVSKGGKTVPSNLRVLCSKCNGRKGAKYDD